MKIVSKKDSYLLLDEMEKGLVKEQTNLKKMLKVGHSSRTCHLMKEYYTNKSKLNILSSSKNIIKTTSIQELEYFTILDMYSQKGHEVSKQNMGTVTNSWLQMIIYIVRKTEISLN